MGKTVNKSKASKVVAKAGKKYGNPLAGKKIAFQKMKKSGKL